MNSRVEGFLREENGGISADWVILTAGAVALVLGATNMVFSGAEKASNTLSTTIAERPVGN